MPPGECNQAQFGHEGTACCALSCCCVEMRFLQVWNRPVKWFKDGTPWRLSAIKHPVVSGLDLTNSMTATQYTFCFTVYKMALHSRHLPKNTPYARVHDADNNSNNNCTQCTVLAYISRRGVLQVAVMFLFNLSMLFDWCRPGLTAWLLLKRSSS